MDKRFAALAFLLLLAPVAAPAAEPGSGELGSGEAEIRAAVAKAIPLLEKGAAGAAEQRTCFTCHSQAVPVFALAEARRRGFEVDEENFKRQLDHTAAHIKRGKKQYLDGKGQGGKVLTAGYALWTLEEGGREPDEETTAAAAFLLEYQKDKDHWRHPGRRPPSSGSDFTATYVAVRGLTVFGGDEQQQQIESRLETIRKWLLSAEAKETEDRVFRLRTLHYLDAGDEAIQQAAKQLLDLQRDDGGWAQKDDLESDAYATGTVLVALRRSAELPPDHEAIQRGVAYLLKTQLEDGSWQVKTRARGFQTYFESGFPHGKDQFISHAASAWSALALMLALPEA